VLTEAMKALDDFQRVNSTQKDEEGPLQTQSLASWKPPLMNFVKINWDVALDHRNLVLGIGIIARDDAGQFLSVCSMKKQMSVRSVVTEAIAAFYAMLFAKENGYKHMCFEGDALKIVQEVNSNYPCDSSNGHFMEDIKTGLLSFDFSQFNHVKREANMATHVLAKQVCNHVVDYFRCNTPVPYWEDKRKKKPI
jgi:hypothetical protein